MNRFFLVLLWAGLAAPAGAEIPPGPGFLLDSYAAVVNGKVITVGQILAALQPAQERLAARYEGEALRQRLLEEYEIARNSFIDSELILVDFEMQGGAIPDRAVEDHINSVIHDRFGNDRTAFLQALAAERLTFAEWRSQMKEQFTIQVMRQREVYSKILITPLDLQTAYDQKRDSFTVPERVRIRTLILPAGDDAAIAELRARLRSGQTTWEEATDIATLQDEGEFIDLDSIAPVFRAAIAPLSAGEVSEPVQIGGQTYFVHLVERQAARMRPYEEVVPELERELRRTEFERLNRIWMDSLRTKYYVQTFTHNLFD